MKLIRTDLLNPADLPPREREWPMQCSVKGCPNESTPRTIFCRSHYAQQWYLKQVGRDKLLTRVSKERWIHSKTSYVMIKVNRELVYEHRVLAEKALGKPLPKGAVIHHMGAPDDNHGFLKLVICPSQEYHMLLHRRMGHANNQYS